MCCIHCIRSATVQDIPTIQACAREAFARYVKRIGKKPAPMTANFALHVDRYQVAVIESESHVKGYVIYFPGNGAMLLDNIAVFTKYLGQGLGRKLIEFVESEAQRFGLSAVELYTNEKMTENISLYPSLGYDEIARRCEDGFDRVYFSKQV